MNTTSQTNEYLHIREREFHKSIIQILALNIQLRKYIKIWIFNLFFSHHCIYYIFIVRNEENVSLSIREINVLSSVVLKLNIIYRRYITVAKKRKENVKKTIFTITRRRRKNSNSKRSHQVVNKHIIPN